MLQKLKSIKLSQWILTAIFLLGLWLLISISWKLAAGIFLFTWGNNWFIIEFLKKQSVDKIEGYVDRDAVKIETDIILEEFNKLDKIPDLKQN